MNNQRFRESSLQSGIVNAAFVQERNKEPVSRMSSFGETRRYHSDTSLNSLPQENDFIGLEKNPSDNVFTARAGPQGAPARSRHRSQPHGPREPREAHPRPVSSLVSMDGMVYDPAQRRFHRRRQYVNSDGNDPRMLLQVGGQRTYLSSTSVDSSGKISPNLSSNGLRIGVPSGFNPDSRSVGRNSEIRTPGGVSGSGVRDAASLASLERHAPSPSTPGEKSKMFRLNLTTILSCIYAVFVITVGIIIFIFDIFVHSAIAEIYCLYLVIVGFCYILYLLVDIRIYVHKAKQHHKDKRKHEEAYDNMMKQSEHETLDGPLTFVIPGDEGGLQSQYSLELPPPVRPLDHPYCFSQGRHAGSFYLKLGAAGFCLGHLVHSALLLVVQSAYLRSDTDCGSTVILALDVLYPLYSFCQLFFIFKYSNVIILRSKELGRFALMHCISSSLCFWIWTIIRETMDSLAMYAKKKVEKGDDQDRWSTVHWTPVSVQPIALPLTSYRMPGALHLRAIFNISQVDFNNCSAELGFDNVFNNLSPYLYPFTIEYSILIVGIFYILWQNIGDCPRDNAENGLAENHKEWVSYKSWENEQCKLPTAVDDNGLVSNLVIHVDCHSSNKGLFGGILILVLTIASIIVCFITINSREFVEIGILLIDVTEITLHAIMLIAVLVAYGQIKKLDVNQHPVSLLDDLLLFICIPAFFMELIFTLLPAIVYHNYLQFVGVTLTSLQVLVQTPFITDALRRCSNSRQLQRAKPGRELVTLLVVCNVSTWIFETFSVKNAEINDLRYDYYGKILWTILGHISTPLCMFYRFHSSVCLVDIWKGAYQPGNNH